MPTENLQNEVYRKYDMVVSEILSQLMRMAGEIEKIRLFEFNRKKKSHLLVLRIALMANDLTQIPVEIECGWWDRTAINWKIRKHFNKVKKAPDFAINGTTVEELLNLVVIRTNLAVDFENIYNAYYEGSLD